MRRNNIRVSRKDLRFLMLTLPLWGIILYIIYLNMVVRKGFSIYDPYEAITLSFVVAVTLIPASLLEYKWEWETSRAEYEIPVILSAIESGLRAGLSLPEALRESIKYARYLRKDFIRLLNALAAGENIDSAIKYLRKDTPLLSITADYLRVLAKGGEELFRTLRDFRESVEVIVNYTKKLREATRSFLTTVYMVLIVYLITTAIFLQTFLYPLSRQATRLTMLGHINAMALTSLIIYGALIESVLNGIATSYFTGSRYLSSLFHALVLLFISIIVYTVLLYMHSAIPLPGVAGVTAAH